MCRRTDRRVTFDRHSPNRDGDAANPFSLRESCARNDASRAIMRRLGAGDSKLAALIARCVSPSIMELDRISRGIGSG